MHYAGRTGRSGAARLLSRRLAQLRGNRPFVGRRAGVGNLISSIADVDFFRMLPTGGYTKGLRAALRTDVGEGDIPPETRSKDFFAYKPFHLNESPPRPSLAPLTNAARQILASGKYEGAIFTQGSPQVEETAYWFNLLIDTTVPICGTAAQRPHGEISNDGPKNLTDSVEYIASRVWADEHGRNRAGVIVLQEQQFFAAREVMKVDARPGGYVATGGHGGILGGMGTYGEAVLHYVPALKHTYQSEVNLSKIPSTVPVARVAGGRIECVETKIRDANGDLLETAIPSVAIVKDGGYYAEEYFDDPSVTADLERIGRAEALRQSLGWFRHRGPDTLRGNDISGAAGGPAKGDLRRPASGARRPRQPRRLR